MTKHLTASTFSKTDRIIYWFSTGLISLLMGVSIIFYVRKHDIVANNMTHLGYPTYLSYILPFTKATGIIIILFSKWANLKEWAYSGLFINCTLAFIAHGTVGDGWINLGTVAMILILVSYFYSKKSAKQKL